MAGVDPMKRYEWMKQIGKGTYGKVSLMRDRNTTDLVVVKTIALKAKDQKARTAATKEAKVLEMMQHPNIIGYRDSFFDSHGDFNIVLEYADGKDLQKYLETHTDISESQVLQIFTQIILGLEYIHSHNILHRDIKTANVFLFRQGLVKLGDFGIAREISGDDLAKTLIGTPYFMSPELLKGQRYSFPSDVWAAGCVLYELMNRRHAFTGKSREELFANIMSGESPEMPTRYSRELIGLLRSILQQDPARRPTCKDILESPLIGAGLEVLQAKLFRSFGGAAPKPTRAASRRPSQPPSASQAVDETDSELGQETIPEWLLDDSAVQEELVRQSRRMLEKDRNLLLGVVRSSISRKSGHALRTEPRQRITGNLRERKQRLEEDARRALGDKYDAAYQFIAKYGQTRRDELLGQLGIGHGGPVPEMELRMIETLTAIEACE
jgi:NIMA (never in mitosis gene a)-related kinase